MASKQDLQNIDPYLFEVLVANLWQAKGYATDVRDKSKDRGVDVEAQKDAYKEFIQVKRYNNSNKIGSKTVREYATLYQQIPTANTVVIVSSGYFTNEAKELAKDLKVEIFNGDQILRELDKHDVGIDSISSDHQVENTDRSENTTDENTEGTVGTHSGIPQMRTSEMRVEVLSIIEGSEIADFGHHTIDELTDHLETGNLSDRVGVILGVTCLDSKFTFSTHKISFISDEGYEYQNTRGLFTGYFEGGLDERFSGFKDEISHKQTKNYLCVSDPIPEGISITGIKYQNDFSFSIDFSKQRRELLENNPDLIL